MNRELLNSIKLLRIPFSVFLMPMYWFALSQMPEIEWGRAGLIFLVLHLFVYPASNGYNSYFDRDEGSIGGLKQPPKVTRQLFYLVVGFDVAAIGLALLLNWQFAAMVALYTLMSKAYSWDKIRLKKYPIASTATVVLFQGGFTYLMVQQGMGMDHSDLLATENLLFALVSTLFLLGSYPITQVYQHKEDSKRGDRTLSLLLGIDGTFVFSGIAMAIAGGTLGTLFLMGNELINLLIFGLAVVPILIYMTRWVLQIKQDADAADFDRTMRMNQISSVCMSGAFIAMLVARHIW